MRGVNAVAGQHTAGFEGSDPSKRSNQEIGILVGHHRRGAWRHKKIPDEHGPTDRFEQGYVCLGVTGRRDDLEFGVSTNDLFGHGLGRDRPRRPPEQTTIGQQTSEAFGIEVLGPVDKDRTAVPLGQVHRVAGVVFVMVCTTYRRDRNILEGLKNQPAGVGKARIHQQIPNPIKADLKTQHPSPSAVKPIRRNPVTKILDLDRRLLGRSIETTQQSLQHRQPS